MLAPGVVEFTLGSFRAWNVPLVATLAWHLGPKIQNESMLEGYDQAVEDRLLDSVDWRADGYELFRSSAFAGSSRIGRFPLPSESNGVASGAGSLVRLGGQSGSRYRTGRGVGGAPGGGEGERS